jgi:hypothetical protein
LFVDVAPAVTVMCTVRAALSTIYHSGTVIGPVGGAASVAAAGAAAGCDPLCGVSAGSPPPQATKATVTTGM